MRTITFLIINCLIFLSAQAQIGLSSTQWQEDLRFLQTTIHQEYPFLLKKISKEDFDASVEKLHTEIPNLQEHEIIVGLARIVSSIKYGHTAISLSSWNSIGPVKFHRIPVNFYWYNDGIHLQGVHKKYEINLGAKVLEIEGMPIEKALKMIYPTVPAENDQYFKAFGISNLGIPEVLHAQKISSSLKPSISLKLEKDGKSWIQEFEAAKTYDYPGSYSHFQEKGDWLDARDNGIDPLYLKNLGKIYFYEYLPEDKAVYVRQSQIQDDPSADIPTFYAEVFDFIEKNEVEKLIIDVRLNGGGNNYKNKPVVTGIIQSEKINQVGRLFVIVGRRTFSACQNLINELDNYTNAIFIGEPSAENINFYGDVHRVLLPNSKIPTRLSFAWWQDKPQWENADWTAPHIAVDMSFAEYAANQDPVLQTALDFTDNDFVLDPMDHLTKLYEQGKLQELGAEAAKFVADPRYKFFDFEAQFNQVGYNLLGGRQFEPAIMVFQLNTQLFPKSANAWDSLGEAFWKTDNKEKAIEYYEKAISLDPNGPIGENRRKMLKEIRGE
ncbi:MAG: tetratricopeptide repeat protein [Bacteroidota bacterium]